jgi:hypothetical protein
MRCWKVILPVFLMFAAAMLCSCGEDKPVPPPAGEQKAESAAEKKADEPAAKAEASKDEDAAKKNQAQAGEPGKEQPSADEEARKREAEAAEKAAREAVKIQLDRTLRKVTAYGVTGPIDKTRDAIVALMPQEAQEMMLGFFNEGLKRIAEGGKLKNMDWLDLSRGIGFAFEGKDRPLLAIPVVEEKKFTDALPDGTAPDENRGYAMGDVYVLPYGKYLLMSDSYRNIELMEGDIKMELTRLSTDQVLLVILGGESLKTLVSSGLDEAERSLGETMPMQQEQKEFMAKFFNFIKEVLGEVEQIRVSVNLVSGNLVLRGDLTTLDGTKLRQTVNALKPATFETAAFLPAKSYLVMAQNMPMDVFSPWMARYVDLIATAWNLKDDAKGDFGKSYAELLTYFGADTSVGFYIDSSFPMSISSVARTTDGLAARDKLYAFYSRIFDRVLMDLPADQKQIFANRSLKEIVDSIAPILMNLGVGAKLENEEYQNGKVDSLVFTFDWTKLSLPPDAAWLKEIIKAQLGMALGFSKEHIVMTFGPNPVVRAKEVLDKTASLKLAELAGPEVLDAKYFLLFALSLERLLTGLMDISVVAQFSQTQPWIGKLREVKEVVSFWAPQPNGLSGEMRVNVKSIVEAFKEPLLEALKEESAQSAPSAPAPAAEAAPAAAEVPPPGN